MPIEVPVITKTVTGVAYITRSLILGIADNHVPNPVYARMVPVLMSSPH
jgi:hypothetical protein